jgi:hypothetical protein
MSKSPPRSPKPQEKQPDAGSRRWVTWAVVGLFVVIAMAAVLISDLTSESGAVATPALTAIAGQPTNAPQPTLPAPTRQTSSTLTIRPTNTVLPVNPAGQVATPPPKWDELVAPLVAPAGGWNLLVLHTNDTWGYVLPCG